VSQESGDGQCSPQSSERAYTHMHARLHATRASAAGGGTEHAGGGGGGDVGKCREVSDVRKERRNDDGMMHTALLLQRPEDRGVEAGVRGRARERGSARGSALGDALQGRESGEHERRVVREVGVCDSLMVHPRGSACGSGVCVVQ